MRALTSADLAQIEHFKTAFRHHPAGVAIVAGDAPEGRAGLTVSSLASVGVDPAAVSFSVSSDRGSAGAVLASRTVGISLLDARHVDVARAFALPGAPRFTAEQRWTAFDDETPYLADAPAALRCRIVGVTPIGASSLVLAEVFEIRAGDRSVPMVYVDRMFHGVTGPI